MSSYQPPGGYPPPAGQPMQQQYQQPQQPQQQYQPPPQQQQGAYPPQQPAPPMQAPPQNPGMPVYYAPDEAAVTESMNQLEQEAAQRRALMGEFAKFLKVPDCGVGQESYVDVYFCGGWSPEIKVPYVKSASHFVKTFSKPKGIVLKCTGDDTCRFDISKKLALASPDVNIQQSAEQWKKIRRQTVYNVFSLTAPQSHYGQDGVMRPFMLGASAQLQSDIKKLIDTRGGFGALCDPTNGRPVRIVRKRTGPEVMNVEWGCIDLNQAPLDPYFYPGLQNIWNLEEQAKPSSDEEIDAVLRELGWPIPDGGTSVQVPQGYNPAAQAPYPNPYSNQPPQQTNMFSEQYPAPTQMQDPPIQQPGGISSPPIPPAPAAGPGGYPPPPMAPGPAQGASPPPPVTSTGQGVPPPPSPPSPPSAPPGPGGVPPGNGPAPY